MTKIIRQHGTMKATLANPGDSIEHLQDQLRATVLPTNNIEQVSTKTAYPAPGVGKISFWLTLVSSTLSCVSFQNVTVT